MATVGTETRPAVLRVHTPERGQQLIDYCREMGIHAIVGVQPDQPEDLTDLDRALDPPKRLRSDLPT